jgi:cell division transport system permease protein
MYRATGRVVMRAARGLRAWNERSEARYPNRREQMRQVRQSVLVSLRHNLPLTVAGVLCSAVALCLVGSSLIVSDGVSNATLRWRGGVETIVFVEPNADSLVVSEIGAELGRENDVESVEFVSQEAAYLEFKEMFRTSPELVRSVGPEALPASWRIIPKKSVPEDRVDELGKRYETREGVYQVVYAKDAVKSVLMVSQTVRVALNLLALFLGGAAILLALASCRAAAWARREELAVMRLVGAGRWLVRLPFAVEGAVQGFLGSTLASFGVWQLADYIEERVASGNSLAILRAFNVSSGERIRVILLLMVIGVIGGALGASVAVGRYARAREGLPTNLVLRFFANGRMALKRRARRLKPSRDAALLAAKKRTEAVTPAVRTEEVETVFEDAPSI